MQVPATARQEIKFVARTDKLTRLQHWVNHHSAGFTSAYPDRRINNVYFDTFNQLAYAENLAGGSARTKLRYRWYGDSKGPDHGVLERKCKRNYFGWKIRYPVAESPYHEGDHWRAIIASLRRVLPADGSEWLAENPNPVMINRYSRSYFLSADEKIRVTIDTAQSVWDQRFKPYPNFLHRANLPETLVVEIKFDRHDRDIASQVIQGMPLRVSRHSKYMVGVGAISAL